MSPISKVELLAPAGDLYRGKIAIDFGADAIYLGGQAYSLRARASNFDLQAIKEMSEYAHSRGKKIYMVINTLNQNTMMDGFDKYFKQILKYKPDAFIVSDPFVITQIKKLVKNPQIHISTQQSVSNSKAAMFFARNKCSRIVLSREVSFKELKLLIHNVDKKIEIETFVHGAVCISYSGRCMLSSNFCLRDANIGGCAQSCRWEMKLFDEKNKVYSDKFTMSAKDMCLINKIDDLIKVGVSSFKIEGRMKTEHYIATVVNAYRNVVDIHYKKSNNVKKFITDVANAANRQTDLAWYDGLPGIDKMLYHDVERPVKQNFAMTIKQKINEKTYIVLTRNKICLSDNFQVLSAIQKDIVNIKLQKIINDSEEVETVNAPMSIVTIIFDKNIDLQENDIIRIL
ncbi:MAG: U32 family peptidase [Mycoplasmoidaceae bacterium]|nr:MAG: U32 family peptidase [Mycoplasmoidaceae bacterium]